MSTRLLEPPEAFASTTPQADVHRFWKEVAQDGGPEVFRTPRFGGHWIVTRAEDLRNIRMITGIFLMPSSLFHVG